MGIVAKVERDKIARKTFLQWTHCIQAHGQLYTNFPTGEIGCP